MKVLNWYEERRRKGHTARPNLAHQALARATNITHITQNVDSLLSMAGAGNIIHLHGTLHQDRCHAACGFTRAWEPSAEPAPGSPRFGSIESIPRCPRCNSMLRPDVVWFGEQLPQQAFALAEEACLRADLMLVIGTSASVWPAAGFIDLAARHGAVIISVNLEPGDGDISLVDRAGIILPLLID